MRALDLLASQEAWQHGVTANVIAPGPIAEIASLEAAVEEGDHSPAWRNRAAASPQDIAEASRSSARKQVGL